jgi:hypothetical protein
MAHQSASLNARTSDGQGFCLSERRLIGVAMAAERIRSLGWCALADRLPGAMVMKRTRFARLLRRPQVGGKDDVVTFDALAFADAGKASQQRG